MEEPIKGTVTSLSSMFPVEDAHKAAKRVQDTISEKQQELNKLNEFIADNTSLINLVQKLPDDLHHDIMVPFGKAAFFPGRLIHTNEFLVLLGEGYYADRTSKQTVDILKRRGKGLQSQVDSLNAVMQDLKAEASFFHTTASEAAEGLLEIREEYEEENSAERVHESGPLKQDSPSLSEADNKKVAVEDEEYSRMMSRLDELEKEELAAESDNVGNEDEQTNATGSDNESDEDEPESDNESDEDEENKADFNEFSDQDSPDHDHLEDGQPRKLPRQTKEENTITEELSNKYHHHRDFTDQLNCAGLTPQPVPKDEMPRGRSSTHNVKKSNPAEKSLLHPEVKEKVEAVPSSGNVVPVQTSKPEFDSSKAFTGSVIEHTHNLPQGQTSTSSQSSGSQPSKPVSRFKMQRK